MRTLINTLLVVGMSVFVPGLACATPTGGTVVGGAASISQSGNTTTINQTSQNAIINWQSFNTNPSEVAQFIQPNSSAAALNRITNGLPTTFQGQLLANGRVFIVNPNGILFTGTSSINVGSLFATTADIQNSDFMNGNYHFQQAPNNFSSVINNGSITANGDASIGGQGLVALVAPGVQNNGVITANMGKVVLASGTSYTVDFYGDQLINFDVGSNVSQKPHDTNGNTLNELVSNNGEIYANGGKVILTARAASNVVDNVISMGGYIEAKSAAVGSNGVIILGGSNGAVKVSGKINVSGKHLARKGGTVKVLGQYVQLTDNASIDASGDIGGGTILIGGNAAGLGPEPNSLATYIGPQVTLDASATDNGNGGNIVTWGTNVDQIYGTLLARGGPNGGNGGFIETSGHWVDTYGIQINASAPLGAAGTWLLDPLNLVVTAPDNNLNITGGNPTTIKPGTAGTGTVDPTTITNLLSLGTSVILTTSGTIGGSFGDITVSSAINAGSADPSASLTLDAVGSIIVNASINLAGSLILHSTNNISISAPITTSNLSGINTVTSGSITMTADLGNIIVNSNVTTGNANSSSGDATTGSINLSAHGSGGLPNAIFINSPLTTGTATGTTISTSGNISVTNFRAGIFASGNPALVIGDTTSGTGTAGSISLSSTNGNIDNGAGGAIQIQQGLFSGGGNEGTLTVNTIGSGNAFIDTTGNSNTDTILQTSNIAGDFQLTSAGPNSARIIQLGGSLTVGGTTTITANGGENITLTNPNNSFTGAVSLTNTNNANTSISATGSAANNSLIFGTTSVGSGNFNIVFQGNGSSNPTITQTGSITTAGPTSITLNSSGVDISLANATNFFNGGLPVNNSAGNIHNFGLNDATTNAGSTFTSNYFSDMSNLVDLTLNFGNGDLNLPAILAHGNATLISPAGMHQTAPIVVNGNTSLTTNGSPSSIDFQTNGTNNAFTGPISLTGGNIYIVNSVPTILDTSTTDILSIFSGGSITQVGTITTHGLFTIQPNVASSDILLANFPNDFQANLAIVNPGNIRDFKIRNVDAGGGIQIPGLTGMNNLRDLTLIFDNAPGTGTFTIQDLSFAALSLRDVDLEFGAAGLVLNNITNTPQAGNLIAHANGSITQAPQSFEALHIGGTSDFAAAANPITLTNTHNTFTGAVTFFNSGTNDVSVFDSIALLLGASSIGQNFFATAGGSISQAPASTLSVGGNTTLGVSAGGSDILLGNTGNDFAGTISFSNTFPADLANIRDINIDNSNASATVPDFTGLTNLRNLTLTFENNSMTFGSSITLNNGGSFNLFDTSNTANKDIDFGTGLSFIAGDNTVTGTNQTVIGGSVNASSTNGNILGSSTLQSGAATLTDNVGATGGTDTVTSGSISLAAPSGTVSASLGLSFGNATLNDQGNSTNNVTSGGYSLSQSPSIVLSPITTGSATFAGTNITATSVNTITSGNLSFTSTTGNITGTTLQTGNVLISGTLPVDTTTQLNSGSVTLNAGGSTGGVGIGLSGSPAIITGNATNSTGTPTGVTANGGNLTLISAGEIDNGTIGNALSIQLGSATGAATTNSGTLSITTTTANGNALINATTPVNLGTSSISQFLNLVAAGNISQSGTLTISGGNTLTSSFNAGANTITLNDATNNISTNVSLTTTGVSNDATIFNSVPLSFDTSSVTGNLIADTSAGNAAITQLLTGTGLAITGTSTFNAGAATITLNNTNNTLTGAVSFNNAGANDISVVNNTNLIFGNSTIGNNLTATANGTITQVAPLTIPGTSSFTANGGNDITLNDPNNDFTGAVSFTDSGSANTSVTDTNSLILGTLNLGSGALNIAFGANTTNPSLSQTGVLTVPGTTNITVNGAAGGSDVLLGSFANVFSSLPIINSAANVRDFALRDTTAGSGTTFSANYFSNMTGLRNLTLFFDNGALTLPDATLTAGGNLIATTSAGAISQNVGTTLIVPGTSTFTATGAHAITVANTNNQFTGDFIFTNGAAPVSVLDSIALSFGTSSTAGNLIATGAGISESGTLSVSGTSNFTATGNNAISLTNANSLGGAVLFNNGNANVDITNATNLIFGPTTSTTGGNLTADATGSITQTGALSVAGTSSFSSGANPITLNNASNSFTDAVSFSNSGSNDVSVVDGIALLLGTSTIGQNFSATAGGTGIAQSGGTTLTIGNTGTTTLGVSALNGDIILGNTGNNLGTSVIFTNGIPVDIRDINLDNNNTAAAVPSFTGLTNLRNLTLTFENNSMIFGSSITLNHGGSFNLFDTSNTANKDIDFGSGLSFIAGINTVTGTSQTVTGGNVNATSNNGSILGSSTLQSGAATLNDTVGATGGTDTVTSGSIALSAPSGTVSNTLALSFGNATLNGTGNSTNNVTSGGYSLSQSSSIALPSITTGTATFAGTNITANSINTITSGDISFISTNGNITGSSLQTGNVSLSGTLPSNTTTQLIAGNITLNAGGAAGGVGIGLTGSPALVTGNATNSTGTSTGVTTSGGNISLTATATSGEIDNGTLGSPLVLQLGNNGTLAISQNATSNGNAFINALSPVVFTNSNVSNNLALTAAGAISQINPMTVGGTSSFTSGANPITLTNTGNNFTGDVSFFNSGNNNVSVNTNDNINLGASTIGGTFTASIPNSIVIDNNISLAAGSGLLLLQADTNGTHVGSITNPSNSTLTIGSGGIALTAGSGIGTLANPILTSSAATTNLAAQNFAGSIFINNIGGALNITTVNGVVGISTIDSSDITINQTGNLNILSPVSTGNAFGVVNDNTSGSIFLNTLTSGNISIGAAVTTGSATTVGTGTNDTATSGSIAINAAGSVSGTGALSTGDASLASGTAGGTDSITSGSISLVANSGGIGLSANPALTIGNATNNVGSPSGVTATAGNIALSAAGEINNGTAATPIKLQFATPSGAAANLFGTLALITTGASGNAYIDTTAATTPIQLAASNISQLLNLTTAGDITQTGSLTILGGNTKTSSFNAGAYAITLTNASNDITSNVSLNNSGANNASIFDLVALTFDNSSIGGTLTATTSNNAIAQKAGSTLTVNGVGTSTFNSGAAPITLANTGNTFTGPLALTTTGANDANILNSIALSFDNSSIGGNLTATAGGNIAQVLASTLSVGGNTILGSSVAASDILLGNTGNNFAGTISFSSTAPAVLANIRDVNLDNANSGALVPSFTGLTNLRNLTLNFENAGINFNAPITLHVNGANTGNLSATANGAITQSGILTVPGTSSFISGANPITLNSANSFTGAVTFTNSGANDVSVVDSIALLLGTSTIGQNFSATAGGTGISQSGGTTLTIGNTSTTTLGVSASNGDIILGNAGNNLGTSILFTNGTPTDIRDINLDNNNTAATVPSFSGLGSLRNLTLTFESNSMTFTSGITLHNGGSFNLFDTSNTANKDIDFGTGFNFIAGANTVTGTNQTVTGGSINATSSHGSILGSATTTLQSGAATLNDTVGATGGTDTVTSGSITLSVPSGNVSTSLGLIFGNALLSGTGNSTNNVTSGGYGLSQSSSIALPSITTGTATFAGTNITANSINTITSGSLSFTSTNGNITGSSLQTGNVSISGTLPNNTTTQLASGSITLNAGAASGFIGIGFGGNPGLATGNATNTTGTATGVTMNAGNLTLTSAGEIDDGLGFPIQIQLGGATGAGTQNNGTLSIITTGASGNAWINASSPVNLGLSNISQFFNLTAAGNISQAPGTTLSVGGNATFGVSVSSSDIILGNTGNDLGTTITFGGTLGDIRDINLDNNNTAATVPSFSGLGSLRNLTLTFENNSMTFGSSITLNNGGSFNLFDTSNTANKDIDFGTGLSFIAGINTVTGTNQTVTGGSIHATSSHGSIIGSSTLQSGAATLNDTAGATGGTDTVTSGSISLSAPNGTISTGLGLSFGNALLNGTGNSTNNVTSGGYSFSQGPSIVINPITTGSATFAGTNITANSINTITSGDISFTATNGNITGSSLQTGNVSISGSLPSNTTTQLNSGSISLNAGVATGGIGIALTGSPALVTGNATNSTGTATGVIMNAGNLTLTSAGEIDNGNPGHSLEIQLGGATGPGTQNSSTLVITTTTTSGSAYIDASTAVNLGLSSISQLLNLTATGNISQTGALTISGGNTLTSSFGAGTHSITLNNAANNILTNVSLFTFVAGNNATIFNSAPLSFDNSSVGGNLIANTSAANAAISQLLTGTGLAVTGTSTFNAGAAAITLNNTNNSLTGAVSFNNSGTNDISVINNTNLIFGNSTIGNNLTATANGTITQVAALTIPGTSSFTANGGNDINLSNANNDFTGAVSFTDSGSANTSVTDINSLTLGTLSLGSGALNIAFGATTTNPSLSETGILTVPGATNITVNGAVGGSDVLLGSFANVFNSLPSITNSANVRDFALRDATVGAGTGFGATYFSAMTGLRNLTLFFDSGDLTLPNATLHSVGNLVATTSAGAISQNVGTTLIVPGTSTFTATGANAITVANAGNQFVGDFIFNNGAAPVSVLDSLALSFSTSSTTGNLIATGAGISESSTLSVGGTSNFTATANNAISLTNANNFTGAVLFNNGSANVAITNAINLIFGPTTSSTSGNLTANATGSITQTGSLSVTGTSSFSSGANPITLTNTGNSFTGDVSLNTTGATNDASVTAGPTINLGSSNVGRNIILTSIAGNINDPNANTVTATGLALTAQTGIGTALKPILSAVTNLAAQNFVGSIFISNTSATLNITTVGALTGISTIDSSDINLNQNGILNISAPISTGPDSVATNNTTGSIFINVTGGNFTSTAGGTITTGNATTNTGTGPRSANTGSIFLNTLISGDISLGDVVATGVASTTGTSANDTAASGSISINSVGGISGANSLSTGNATLSGTSTGSATSGSISLNANNTIGLSATPALIIGTPTSTTGSTATAGNINLSSGGDIYSGLLGQALFVQFGLPTGAATNNLGTLAVNAGAGVNIDTTASTIPIVLDNSNITNGFQINTAGSVSQKAGTNIIVGLQTTLSSTQTNSDFILGNTGNSFGPLGFVNTLANIRDVNIDNTAFTASTFPILSGLTSLRNLTLTTDTGAMTFANGPIVLHSGGNAIFTAHGTIDFNGVSVTAGSLTSGAPGTVTGGSISATSTNGNIQVTGVTTSTLTSGAATSTDSGSSGGTDTVTSGTITLAAPLGSINYNNLSLVSGDATLSGTGNSTNIVSSGGFSFTSGNPITLSNITTGSAISNGSNLNTVSSGNISVTAPSITDVSGTVLTTGDVFLTGSSVSAGSTATAGTVTLNANGSGSGILLNTNPGIVLGNATFSGTGTATTHAGSVTLSSNNADINLGIALGLASGGSTNLSTLTITATGNTTPSNVNIGTTTNTNPVNLSTSTISGHLNLSTDGDIFQGGSLTILNPNSGFSSGINTSAGSGSIFLNDVGNVITNPISILTGTGSATLFASSPITIDDFSSIGGNFSVNTSPNNSAISETNSTHGIQVTGNSSFISGNAPITLNNVNNGFSGTVFLNSGFGNNASIYNNAPLVLGTSSIGGTFNASTNNFNITQAPGNTLTVNGLGTSTFNSGSGPTGSITLADSGNNFSGPVSLTTTNNASILNSIALSFDNSSIGGNLVATSNGSITQTSSPATLTVNGTTTLNVTQSSSDIILYNTGNTFGGAISFAGTVSNIRDVQLDNASGSATVPDFSALSSLRNLNLIFETTGINFNTSITLTGNLLAHADGGAITQSAALTIPGTSAFTAVLSPITLDDNSNRFTGAVSLFNTGTNQDVSIVNSIALLFGTSVINNNFSATAGGSISQAPSSVLIVPGNTSLGVSVGGSDILLGNTGNNFIGTISFSNTAPAALANIRDINLDNANASASIPSFAGLGALRNLTLNFENAAMTIGSSITLFGNGGSFNLTANNDVTVNNANLKAADNTASGTGATVQGGNIAITSNTGNINVIGSATLQTGNATLTDNTGGAGTDNVTSGGLTLSAPGTVSNAFSIILGNATLDGKGAAINNITSGNLTLSNAGAASLTTGSATFNAVGATGTNTIKSGNINISGSSISGAGIFTTGDASLTGSVSGGSSNINSGNITVTSTGGIGLSGSPALVTGNATGLAGTTTTSGNISLIAAGEINNGTAATPIKIKLGTATGGTANSGALAITTTGGSGNAYIDTTASVTPIQLAASSISGIFNLFTAGNISETGVLTVGGTSSFNAGATTNNINLNTQNNDFTGAISFNNVNDVLVKDINALALGASTISGSLTVNSGATSAGNLTETGALVVTGTSTFNAGATTNSIDLSTHNNNLTDNVSFTNVQDVALRDIISLNLAASSVARDLTLISGGTLGFVGNLSVGRNLSANSIGAITQTSPLNVTGTSSFGAGATANDINLNTQNNDFTGAVSFNNVGNVSIKDINALALGASTITGNLIVNSGATGAGDLTETGVLNVTGTSSFNAGATTHNINLGTQNNNFTGAVSFNNVNNASIQNQGAVALDTSVISGNLSLVLATLTAGDLTQINPVAVGGTTQINANNNNVTLTNATNDLQNAISITSANNASITNAANIILGTSTITNALTLNSTGNISQTGIITANSLTSTSVGGVNLPLSNAPSIFNATNTGGGNIIFNNTDSLTITGISNAGPGAGNVLVTNSQLINISGVITNPIGSITVISSNLSNLATSIFVTNNISTQPGSGGQLFTDQFVSFNPVNIFLGTGNITLNGAFIPPVVPVVPIVPGSVSTNPWIDQTDQYYDYYIDQFNLGGFFLEEGSLFKALDQNLICVMTNIKKDKIQHCTTAAASQKK